jgi:hypothetical protein
MVVKKKKIQKGGELQNEIFTEYFSDIFKLINDLIESTIETYDELHRILNLNKSASNNILFKQLINELESKIPSQETINKSKKEPIFRKVKNILYIIIFIRIVKFVDGETFISKLINIYIYMLFINYFILLGTLKRHSHSPIFIDLIMRIISLQRNIRIDYGHISYNNVPNFNETKLKNVDSKLEFMKTQFNVQSDFSKEEFLGRIKNFFMEYYSEHVPILYGNDYVGNLRDKKYIINPVGAFILKLYNLDIGHYKRRLLQLLQSVIGSDKIPDLRFLQKGRIFCIMKERNIEKICEQKGECSRFTFLSKSLYNQKMTAEITEKNIASNEHILELLDILLNIYLQHGEDILGLNIDRNVITHLNLRRNITASQNLRRNITTRQNLNSLQAERQNPNSLPVETQNPNSLPVETQNPNSLQAKRQNPNSLQAKRQNPNSLQAERPRTISNSRRLFALGAHNLGAHNLGAKYNNNNNNNNNNN